MKNNQRISITLTEEIQTAVEQLKKESFYNKSYSELYRQAIAEGLLQLKARQEQNEFLGENDEK